MCATGRRLIRLNLHLPVVGKRPVVERHRRRTEANGETRCSRIAAKTRRLDQWQRTTNARPKAFARSHAFAAAGAPVIIAFNRQLTTSRTTSGTALSWIPSRASHFERLRAETHSGVPRWAPG